jgi:DNA-binding NarL/FixJ family response regulator
LSDPPLKLLLIDDDPIFRLGLCKALESFPDLQVIIQDDTTTSPDLIILDPGLVAGTREEIKLYQSLGEKYPDVGIFLLTSSLERQQLLTAQNYGVKGYAPKGISLEELIRGFRQVADGKTFWNYLSQSPRRIREKQWLTRLSQSGLRQIEETLNQVQFQLDNSNLSGLDSFFWQGRKRELLAARWLVNQLLPVIIFPEESQNKTISQESENTALVNLSRTTYLSLGNNYPTAIASILLQQTLAKIPENIKNFTDLPLEIDCLKTEKKRELFYLVIQEIKKTVEELNFLSLKIDDLPAKKLLIIRELWQNSALSFINRYYPESDSLIGILRQEQETIQTDILDKIPFTSELLYYLALEKPLFIERVEYRSEAPEALERGEMLLQNLVISLANGVMAVILNNFLDYKNIQEDLLYSSKKIISSRDLARFRNELSWKYRKEKYWEEPKNIFESKYCLLIFAENGLKKVFIYAPRQQELNQLQGIQLGVTLALEARDAIAPRLRSAIGFIGKGLVYILTQVIGRGIGLIGKGILQGIGKSFK